jgi:predicted molibdopterin-dependent oxidoreductase YjgC
MADMRIDKHPILGRAKKGRPVEFTLDGKKMTGFEGEPIAAALMAQGNKSCGTYGKRHTPRGLFCAVGKCTDCVMTVDGLPGVRTCITPLKPGMHIETQKGLGEWKLKKKRK